MVSGEGITKKATISMLVSSIGINVISFICVILACKEVRSHFEPNIFQIVSLVLITGYQFWSLRKVYLHLATHKFLIIQFTLNFYWIIALIKINTCHSCDYEKISSTIWWLKYIVGENFIP